MLNLDSFHQNLRVREVQRMREEENTREVVLENMILFVLKT